MGLKENVENQMAFNAISGFKVVMLENNSWLFVGQPRTGKTILANMVQNPNIEYHNISKIEQFHEIMKTKIRTIKYLTEPQIMDFIFVTNDSKVAQKIIKYMEESNNGKSR
jgi:hypothetical protein